MRRMYRRVDIGKLGDRDIRPAMFSRDPAKRSIGDPVHGRQADDRLGYVLPKAHDL